MAHRLQSVKRFLLNNWALKVLAVLAGMLTFYGIRGVTSEEASYDIPVNVEVDPGIAIHSQDPQMVKVTFRGSKADLRELVSSRLKVIVEPKASNPAGSEEIPIRSRNVKGFSGVSVRKIEPDIVVLSFDREIEVPIDVAPPRITGMPAIGKAKIEYGPRSVKIRGPKRRLESKRFTVVNTEAVDVDGRVESFTKKVRVLFPRDWVSHIEPSEITVKVNIVTEEASSEWRNATVRAFMSPGAVTDVFFEPAGVRVRLQGRPEVLAGIIDDSIKVFVDCVGLDTTATYELPVHVHLPAGVTVSATVEPKTVEVIFSSE